jgi:hypothetical protein
MTGRMPGIPWKRGQENNLAKLISLKEIEGPESPHQKQIERAMKIRVPAFEFVRDVQALADFIGGRVEKVGLREDWAVSKDIYPQVTVYYIFNRADEEFPASLRILFSGDRLNMLSGEDLAGLTITYAAHMIRYIRESNPDTKLPEVCYRV